MYNIQFVGSVIFLSACINVPVIIIVLYNEHVPTQSDLHANGLNYVRINGSGSFQDGRVECYPESPYIEPALNPGTGVEAKDVMISSEPDIKAQVFMPKITRPKEKLPLVLHYHVVPVDYRLAPENLLPIFYEDSWASMQWVAAHFDGEGLEPWGQPKSKSKITHLVFYTTSDVDMLGADY
ncbi:hypothetical protein RJ639_024225 [Escallonia herrerae]|uniref:Uncharacterized protein n=1 Tax=Escallonia herrerae TaxID=1293975 RepID=A0AA88V0R8_9ASTE|nr:hypothetical protein RJ639_024225 [Escallonia herrerae]